jgi:hypothetical protein
MHGVLVCVGTLMVLAAPVIMGCACGRRRRVVRFKQKYAPANT